MKKMYWHIVTWVHPQSKDRLSVGDVIGYDEKNAGITLDRWGNFK